MYLSGVCGLQWYGKSGWVGDGVQLRVFPILSFKRRLYGYVGKFYKQSQSHGLWYFAPIWKRKRSSHWWRLCAFDHFSKHTYQYDDASNLICVDCGTGTQITYAYDGNNRRVSRTQGSLTTYFVHASNGDLLLEYTPAQSKAIEHFYLNGKRIASKTVAQ